MESITKIIGDEKCECFEYSDPFHGDSGKMRMQIEGTFDGNITRESIILVPMFLNEQELQNIGDLWITEQEKKLGLAVGTSCSSSGWWVGSSDASRDNEITDKYDFLVPTVLANQSGQERLQSEIQSLYKSHYQTQHELEEEYKAGESDWAAQLEVKLDNLDRLIAEHENLLEQSKLLVVGNYVDYSGYYCEVIDVEDNIIYLQDANSDIHFERTTGYFLNSKPGLIENNLEKIISSKQADSISIRSLTLEDNYKVSKLDNMSGNFVEQWLEDNDDYAWGLFKGKELIGYCTIGGADDCGKEITEYPGWTNDSLLLSDVFINPDHRRQGYATQMIDEVIKERTKEDKELVFLTVLYEDLVDLYEKVGFSYIGNGIMVRDERALEQSKVKPSLDSMISKANEKLVQSSERNITNEMSL